MTARTLALLAEHRDLTRKIVEIRAQLKCIEEELRKEQQQKIAKPG